MAAHRDGWTARDDLPSPHAATSSDRYRCAKRLPQPKSVAHSTAHILCTALYPSPEPFLVARTARRPKINAETVSLKSWPQVRRAAQSES